MKTELRPTMRALRADFIRNRGSAKFISDSLLELLHNILNKKNIYVGTYFAFGSECDVMASLENDVMAANNLCLPCADTKDETLTFRMWNSGDLLETSPLGFRQPLRTSPQVVPSVILTPLLAFDRAGNRLGQGAGHYDRAFAEYPSALRIGLAWHCQEVLSVPVDDWDMPLDAIATDKEWIVVPDGRLKA